MRIRGLGWAVVVVIIAAAGYAYVEKPWKAAAPAAPAAPPQRPVPEVSFVVVAPQRLVMTAELAGRTSPFQIAEIRPQVTGIIQKRLFREGADLKAGDILYHIDSRSYIAAYDSSRAQVAKAQSALAALRAKADRFKQLVAIKAISQQDFDDAMATVRQAEADVAVARANMDAAELNVANTNVITPIDGRIGLSSVTVGALVSANQSAALAVVQQMDPMYVDLTQSIGDMMRLRKELVDNLGAERAGSARVTLTLEDGSPYPLPGKLEFTGMTVDRGSASVTLRAVFPNPGPTLLLPGMFVHAKVETGVRENAILVPQQGVARDARGQPTALVLGADDKVELRRLELSSAMDDRWLVDSGLKAGDRVIVEGQQKVFPGAPAKGIPFAPPPAPKS